MHVISASRRTDIPAFYTPWFMNRIRAGYCAWRNPFGGQIYDVSLAPENVIALVFWTRWPRPLLAHLDELTGRGYAFGFHMTITGYGPPLETHNPPLKAAIRAAHDLSARIGPARLTWRYDPVVISSATPADYHVRQFETIAAQIGGSVGRVMVSFLDMYGKTRRNLAAITRTDGVTFDAPDGAARRDLLRRLRDVAARYDLPLETCCEPDAEQVPGVTPGACIGSAWLAGVTGKADHGLKPKPTREHCGCVQATDIGAYETCLFGCRYCYATHARASALAARQRHDPQDDLLVRPVAASHDIAHDSTGDR